MIPDVLRAQNWRNQGFFAESAIMSNGEGTFFSNFTTVLGAENIEDFIFEIKKCGGVTIFSRKMAFFPRSHFNPAFSPLNR